MVCDHPEDGTCEGDVFQFVGSVAFCRAHEPKGWTATPVAWCGSGACAAVFTSDPLGFSDPHLEPTDA